MEPLYNFIAPSVTHPQNNPKTPPPREPSSGTKRIFPDILNPQKIFKNRRTNREPPSPPSPTDQHAPPPTLDLSSIPYNHKTYRDSSSNKNSKARARGSEAEVEQVPGPSSSSKQWSSFVHSTCWSAIYAQSSLGTVSQGHFSHLLLRIQKRRRIHLIGRRVGNK